MADDLVAWLREQIAETERVARAVGAEHLVWHYNGSEIVQTEGGDYVAGGPWDCDVDEDYARHMVGHDPRAVLAQCEAHTAMLDLHPEDLRRGYDDPRCTSCSEERPPCRTVRALALAYQHRPGYQETWKP